MVLHGMGDTCGVGSNLEGKKINKIDVAKEKTVKSLKCPHTPASGFTSLAWDGKYLWFSRPVYMDEKELYKVDPTTGGIITSLDLPFEVTGLAWDGKYLWAANMRIYKIDPLGANSAISFAEGAITNASILGTGIKEAERDLKKAKNAFDEREFKQAREYADKAKEEAEKIKNAYNAISDTKSSISNQKSRGFYSNSAESLLSQAENAFNSGNYEKAKSLAENATALALDIDQDGVKNEEDFASSINNIYIYTGTPIALLVLAFMTKVSLDVRKRRVKERLERERRRLEDERRISKLKAKYEQHKREGYKPDKDLEGMLK